MSQIRTPKATETNIHNTDTNRHLYIHIQSHKQWHIHTNITGADTDTHIKSYAHTYKATRTYIQNNTQELNLCFALSLSLSFSSYSLTHTYRHTDTPTKDNVWLGVVGQKSLSFIMLVRRNTVISTSLWQVGSTSTLNSTDLSRPDRIVFIEDQGRSVWTSDVLGWKGETSSQVSVEAGGWEWIRETLLYHGRFQSYHWLAQTFSMGSMSKKLINQWLKKCILLG